MSVDSTDNTKCPVKKESPDELKRKLLSYSTIATTTVGLGSFAVPFVSSLNPAADVTALSSIEVDISEVTPGSVKKVMWQGKPIFIKHRTQEEIQEMKDIPLADLIDPQTDEERVQKDQWLVTIGICTHLGCIPLSDQGDFDGGWFCPCHGSHYDASGRIRKGPAPKNLAIPKYSFLNDNTIMIG